MPTASERFAQSLARESAGLDESPAGRFARSLRMDRVRATNPDFEYTTNVEAPVLPEDQEQGVARRVGGSFAKNAAAFIPAAQRALATANEFLSPLEGPIARKIGLPAPGEVMRDRARMTENVIDTALPEASNRTFLTNTLPGAVGSVVPILLSGGAAAGPLAVGAIQGYGSGEREADEAGAGRGGQLASGVLNAGLGASEALLGAGKLAGSVMNRTGARVGRQALARAVGGEALQEAGQQLGSNIVARDIVGYDPNRGRLSGVGESALAGGIVGGGVHGLARWLDAARDRMGVSLDPEAFRDRSLDPIDVEGELVVQGLGRSTQSAGREGLPRPGETEFDRRLQSQRRADEEIADAIAAAERSDAFWRDELARAGVSQPGPEPVTPRPIERLRAQRSAEDELANIIRAADAEARARDASMAEAADRASYREAADQIRQDRVAAMEEATRVPRAEPTEDELAALFADLEGREEFRDPRPTRGQLPRPGETGFDQRLAQLLTEREGRVPIQRDPITGYPSQGENLPPASPYYSLEDLPELYRDEPGVTAPQRIGDTGYEDLVAALEASPRSTRQTMADRASYAELLAAMEGAPRGRTMAQSADAASAAMMQPPRRKPPPPRGKRPPEGGDEGGAPPASQPIPPPPVPPRGPAPSGAGQPVTHWGKISAQLDSALNALRSGDASTAKRAYRAATALRDSPIMALRDGPIPDSTSIGMADKAYKEIRALVGEDPETWARSPEIPPAPAPQPPAPNRAGLPPVEAEGRPGAPLGPGGLMKTPRGGFTFTGSLRGTDPSPALPPPKPAMAEVRRATTGDPQRDAKLSEMREAIARRKAEGKGHPLGFNDRMFAYYEKLEASDPSKWKPGDGVSYRVGQMLAPGSQMNRGFRIVEVDPATKMAKVRQVADTGITVSGGADRLSDAWVHIASLVRDNKYNAPAPVAPDATVRPPAPKPAAKPARESVPDFMRAEVVPPMPKGPAPSNQRDFAMGMQPPTLETGANPDADPNTPDMFKGKKPPPPPQRAKKTVAPKSSAMQGSLLGGPMFKKGRAKPFAQREHVSWGEVTKQIAGKNNKIPLSREVAGELQNMGFFDEFGPGSRYRRGGAGNVAKMEGEASRYFYITNPTSQEFGGPARGGKSGTVASGHSDLGRFLPFLEKIGARDSQGNPISAAMDTDTPEILYALQEYSPRGTAEFDPDSPQNVERQEQQAYERDVAEGFEGTREEWRDAMRRESEMPIPVDLELPFFGVPISMKRLGRVAETFAKLMQGTVRTGSGVADATQLLQRGLSAAPVAKVERWGEVGGRAADMLRRVSTEREMIHRAVTPLFNRVMKMLSTPGGAKARAELSRGEAYGSPNVTVNIDGKPTEIHFDRWFYTKGQRMIDSGKFEPGAAGDLARAASEHTRGIGVEAEKRGAFQDDKGNRFRPQDSIFLRMMTPEGREFMSDQSDPDFIAYRDALAAANGMTPKRAGEELDTIYKHLIYGEKGAQGPESIIREAAFEHRRVFPKAPAMWQRADGEMVRLYETDLNRYVNRIHSGQVNRAAIIGALGQTTRAGVPLGPEGANSQLMGIMNDAQKELSPKELRAFTRDFREAVAAAGDVHIEATSPLMGNTFEGSTKAGEIAAAVNSAVKSLGLTSMAIRNTIQTLHMGPTLAGPVEYAKALARVARNPRAAMRDAEAVGAIMAAAHNWKPFMQEGHKIRDLGHWASDSLMRATAGRLTESFNNAVGNEIGKGIAAKIKAGKFTDRASLETMEYSRAEIDAMMGPNPPQELLDTLGQRAAKTINFAGQGGEHKPSAQRSKLFNAVFHYMSFAQNTWQRQARVLEVNARGLQSNDPATQLRATRNILTSLIGAPATGALGAYLVALVSGNWKDTDETKAAKDILTKLGEGEVGAAAAGTMGEMAKASFDYYLSPIANMMDFFDPANPVQSVATSLSRPASLLFEAGRAGMGSGRYADKDNVEKAWEFSQFVAPALRRGQKLFTAVTGMRDPELDKSISRFYDWHAKRTGTHFHEKQPGYDAFRRSMRMAADSLKTGNVVAARKNVRDAILADREARRDPANRGKEPKSPAASLRGRQLVSKLSPKDRRDFIAEVGAVDYARLRTYDRLLEFMAENAE